MFKEVSVETYIDTENVAPRIEELILFKPPKTDLNEYDDDDEDEETHTLGMYVCICIYLYTYIYI
jgi:hypothetical protein